jgi:hypothetical protein
MLNRFENPDKPIFAFWKWNTIRLQSRHSKTTVLRNLSATFLHFKRQLSCKKLPLFFIKTANFEQENLGFLTKTANIHLQKTPATVPSGFPLGLMKESRQEFRL